MSKVSNESVDANVQAAPVAPLQAATVMLLRDGKAGIESFMLERNKAIKFASGAVVFPGGKVDPNDADEALIPYLQDAGEFDADTRALRVGAIREVFEESGVLLARRRGQQQNLTQAEVAAIADAHRDQLLTDNISILAVLQHHDLQLLTVELVYFAHWITPNIRPTRFDTHFYLVALPAEQVAEHDGDESVSSRWINTSTAPQDIAAAGYSAMTPTLMNLDKVSRHPNVLAAMDAARATDVVTVQPDVREAADGTRTVYIPEAAGYGTSSYPFKPGWVKS